MHNIYPYSLVVDWAASVVSDLQINTAQHSKVDHIVTFSRGGLVPTALLAYQLNIPSTRIDVLSCPILNQSNVDSIGSAKHVLIVDDILDSGSTIVNLIKSNQDLFPLNSTSVAVLAHRSWMHGGGTELFNLGLIKRSNFYGGMFIENDGYVIFPWEAATL